MTSARRSAHARSVAWPSCSPCAGLAVGHLQLCLFFVQILSSGGSQLTKLCYTLWTTTVFAVTCGTALQESALEEFLFGSGSAVTRLLAKPDEGDSDHLDITELVKQVPWLMVYRRQLA